MAGSPVYSSTPKGSTKRGIKELNLETPHIPLAEGGIKRKKTATVPEQLNLSNLSLPVDLDSNVSSSRRSVLKKLCQPKKTATGTSTIMIVIVVVSVYIQFYYHLWLCE
ncbi:unnamed protein product [Trichobilharzia szidati]|nr:unnamed protein product [Trichobilharzia szidati]